MRRPILLAGLLILGSFVLGGTFFRGQLASAGALRQQPKRGLPGESRGEARTDALATIAGAMVEYLCSR